MKTSNLGIKYGLRGLLVGLISVGSAHAALVAGLSVQSADIGLNVNMSPSDAIDGQGLPGDTPALTGAHSNTWNDNWWSNQTDPQITIDLGGSYALDTIHVWNYNETVVLNRGLQNVEIYVSVDANPLNLIKLITDGTGSTDNGSGDFLFGIGTGSTDYAGFDLDLSSVTNSELLADARLIQVQAIDTHGSTQGGLAEIQFGGTAVVPEPSSVLLSALGLLSFVIRRRRS